VLTNIISESHLIEAHLDDFDFFKNDEVFSWGWKIKI